LPRFANCCRVNIDANASFEVREETYTLPDTLLRFPVGNTPPDVGLPAEMLGVVVAPVNASGPRPVALFIHGQAATCYDATTGEGSQYYPCPEGSDSVANYRGYLVHQRYLAARGWVTVSISANGVNGSPLREDEASDATMRGELVENHLRRWVSWVAGDRASPQPALLAGAQPDLQRLMVIGHSRGASAANQVALRSVALRNLHGAGRAGCIVASERASDCDRRAS